MSLRSVGSRIAKQIIKEEERKATGRRIQREASERPESVSIETPFGKVWMSPIESELYAAMVKEGLSPNPQYRIEAYFVDFAFLDVKLAVEADGQAFHSGDRRERDRKRDWILKERYGWTVMRFHGSTIHNRAANCAFVIKREYIARRHSKEERRIARKRAIVDPFRLITDLFRRG